MARVKRSVHARKKRRATLERAKGTILKYDNVIMAEEPLVAGGVRVSRKTD